MKHDHYFEVEAGTHRGVGRCQGELFRDHVRESLSWHQQNPALDWSSMVRRSQPYLAASKAAFPSLIEEAQGYAEGAGVPFADLWVLMCEDELVADAPEKCTTVVTNQGLRIAHNEDWDISAKDYLCVLRKTVGDLAQWELHYITTLGGNSASVNSHGFVQTINTLTHADQGEGVPRNVVARWMSQTYSPDADYRRLTALRRSSGYHHTLVGVQGGIWSIECSAQRQALTRPRSPFLHTNHYLTDLKVLEHDDGSYGSFGRYQRAAGAVQPQMTGEALQALMCDAADGPTLSVFNERTIGRVIFDLPARRADVWLRREEEKGWVSYDLTNLIGPAA